MKCKCLMDYEFEGRDINIKCIILSLGQPIIKFNCQTKYEDVAEEVVGELFRDWLINGGSIKEAIRRRDLPIEKEFL